MSLSQIEKLIDKVQKAFFPSSPYESDGRLFSDYVGGSEAYQKVKQEILGYTKYIKLIDDNKKENKKKMPPPLLILGESGTGKTALVEALREFLPERSKNYHAPPVQPQNPDMARSELFGHIEGAFTGAVGKKEGFFSKADNGILFIKGVETVQIFIAL